MSNDIDALEKVIARTILVHTQPGEKRRKEKDMKKIG